jgi:hypothetical protein
MEPQSMDYVVSFKECWNTNICSPLFGDIHNQILSIDKTLEAVIMFY